MVGSHGPEVEFPAKSERDKDDRSAGYGMDDEEGYKVDEQKVRLQRLRGRISILEASRLSSVDEAAMDGRGDVILVISD